MILAYGPRTVTGGQESGPGAEISAGASEGGDGRGHPPPETRRRGRAVLELLNRYGTLKSYRGSNPLPRQLLHLTIESR